MVPRPRRLKDDNPLLAELVLPLALCMPVLPDNDGNWVIESKTLGWAVAWMSAAPTTVVGVGALKPLAVMREAETTTDSISPWARAAPMKTGASKARLAMA